MLRALTGLILCQFAGEVIARVAGVPTGNQGVGVPTGNQGAGVPTGNQGAGVPTGTTLMLL